MEKNGQVAGFEGYLSCFAYTAKQIIQSESLDQTIAAIGQ